MLYDAMLNAPVAKLLPLFPCRGLTFLNQPVQEFRGHEGSLILHPFLFQRLYEGGFRAHQSGGKHEEEKSKANINRRRRAHLKGDIRGFQEVYPRLPGSATEELSDRQTQLSYAATARCQLQERICVWNEQDAFSPVVKHYSCV